MANFVTPCWASWDTTACSPARIFPRISGLFRKQRRNASFACLDAQRTTTYHVIAGVHRAEPGFREKLRVGLGLAEGVFIRRSCGGGLDGEVPVGQRELGVDLLQAVLEGVGDDGVVGQEPETVVELSSPPSGEEKERKTRNEGGGPGKPVFATTPIESDGPHSGGARVRSKRLPRCPTTKPLLIKEAVGRRAGTRRCFRGTNRISKQARGGVT